MQKGDKNCMTIACAVIMAVLCCSLLRQSDVVHIALFSLYLARQIMKFRTKVTFVSDENGNMIEMADAHYIEEDTRGNRNHSNYFSILPSEQLPHAKPVSAAIFARADPVVPLLNADREHTNNNNSQQRPHRHHHRRSNRIRNSEN
jgi:hypothetical protein